ncbi:mannitol dehydrogenase family protein [Streptomyces shenzhenensis]|uniref:mannitol dehydrogenase family protein n=1 Tax=Streptomyces shenzhenensis TaxID=943815 RepID=UPI0033F536FE
MSSIRLCTHNLDALDDRVDKPGYDRSAVTVGIVHFGVGGFHRSHQAMYVDRLMNEGVGLDWGICGVGVMPSDAAMKQALAAQDHLYTLVTRDGKGRHTARVIGSIVDYLYAPDEPEKVLAVLTDPQTRIVSLTVTEGGYNIDAVTGEFDTTNEEVVADARATDTPRTMFGFVVEALHRRRSAGVAPFTVMSCDNIEGNGNVARSSIIMFARLRDAELAEWIDTNVAFPNSMVDRITPVTVEADIAELRDEFGIEDRWPVVCEPFTQWVLEDSFGAGRPPFERGGVQLTDDVAPYELMKLRLLNAGHQALAYAGHLAGYVYAHDAAADPVFIDFLLGYWNEEARPTLDPVPGVNLDDYVQTLLERFTNPAIKDTIARLCASSSDRIPKWVLPVIRANLAAGRPCERGIAIVASWARYAEGVDERGLPIDVQDGLHDELLALAALQRTDPLAFVRNTRLFGDLAEQPGFTTVYQRCLDSLHAVGARQTLLDLNTALDSEHSS